MAVTTLNTSGIGSAGAVAYACSRLGFKVFPLRSGLGTPAFAGWPKLASSDEETIRRWWTGDYAGYSVGVLTGAASGIWVLDIDVKDADGFASLRELCAQHHCGTRPFEQTMVVRTPSGGAHVYFHWDSAADTDGGVVNSVGRLGAGLDVRGTNGYVRAPGTAGYEIVARGGVRHCGRGPAPKWLTALCKKRRYARSERPTNADVRARLSGSGAWARFQAAETVRKLRGAEPGTRNAALNKAAYVMGRMSAAGVPGALDEGSARAACLEAMRQAGARDGLDAQERTFRSGWEAGLAAGPGSGPE